jgi:hypothetical protein
MFQELAQKCPEGTLHDQVDVCFFSKRALSIKGLKVKAQYCAPKGNARGSVLHYVFVKTCDCPTAKPEKQVFTYVLPRVPP